MFPAPMRNLAPLRHHPPTSETLSASNPESKRIAKGSKKKHMANAKKKSASANGTSEPDSKNAVKELIDALNEDLAREYQAIIAYTVYSNVLTGAKWMNIAAELKLHASQELAARHDL